MKSGLKIYRESWPLADAFRISRGNRTFSEVILVEISNGSYVGRGECFPYAHYGETLTSVENQILSSRSVIEDGATRSDLYSILPAGAARNAVDCALWDLEAKTKGTRVWDIAEIPNPKPVTTVFTLGVDEPKKMGEKAAENYERPSLKLKMMGDGLDLERVRSIHRSAPDSALVVDANEGWTIDQYKEYAPYLLKLGVKMVEQPLPASKDSELALVDRIIPVCADESCHDTSSLASLIGKYDIINIKLDKTGGLSEAFRLCKAAKSHGFGIMVGCMIGTSLAMAPAMLVAQNASVIDLDGPLLLECDRNPGLVYDGSTIEPPITKLWG